MNHVDYFGNEIETGDIIIRVQNGFMYNSQVLALRKTQVGIRRPFEKTGKPLWISGRAINYQIINLSKLDSVLIQETIKSFLNEI